MVTRKDVAQQAGVSVTAVSRVVNNSGYVRRDKREAIEKAIEALHYHPNPLATAMQNQQTKQLMFCVTSLQEQYAMDVYQGVYAYAAEAGYLAVLNNSSDMESFKSMMIDGVILPSEIYALQFMENVKHLLPLPAVYISYGSAAQIPGHIPCVEVDTYRAMEMGLEYLIAHGHRKIALATPLSVESLNPRCVAYLSTMLPRLGKAANQYVFFTREDRLDDFFYHGVQIAEKMMAQHCDATAVVCFNDAIALGLMHRLHELGVRIPDDISVMGIDATTMGKMVYPSLTSISLSSGLLGRECARILLDVIHGVRVSRKTSVPISIVEGKSVKTLDPA